MQKYAMKANIAKTTKMQRVKKCKDCMNANNE